MSRLDELREKARAAVEVHRLSCEALEVISDKLELVEAEWREAEGASRLAFSAMYKAGQELTKEKERLGIDG